jgi:peptide/nickel transport system ATP-binding protein
MRFGEVVETGVTSEIFADPQHDYTKELLAAVPGQGWSQGIAINQLPQ